MDLADLVRAALAHDMLTARQWLLDARSSHVEWSTLPEPHGLDAAETAVAAALVELLASRAHEPPPRWAAAVGPAPQPVWLVRRDLPRQRARVERESPPPLAKRRIFAPAGYLVVV